MCHTTPIVFSLFSVLTAVVYAAEYNRPLDEPLKRYVEMSTTENRDRLWEAYKDLFNVSFIGSPIGLEFVRRRNLMMNAFRIYAHNRPEQVNGVDVYPSYRLELNRFSMLSTSETHTMFGTADLPSPAARTARTRVTQRRAGVTDPPRIPAIGGEVDMRSGVKGHCIPEVKDQGTCQICWAFSATIVIEDSYCRAGCGKEVFSVDELFAYYDGPKMAETAFDYIKENEGLSTEKAYPFACSDDKLMRSKVAMRNVNKRLLYFRNITRSEEGMQRFIAEGKGLIVVTINPLTSFITLDLPAFRDGIFDKLPCSPLANMVGTLTTHTLVVVGYGRGEKTGQDYWIMQNTFGTDWGDEGYIKFLRGINHCGLADWPVALDPPLSCGQQLFPGASKNDTKNDTINDIKNGTNNDMKNDTKNDMKNDTKNDSNSDMKNDMKNDSNNDMKNDMKIDSNNDMKKYMKNDSNNDMKNGTPPRSSGYDCDNKSPCNAANRAVGLYHFEYSGDTKHFIQCADNDFQCWTRPCAKGTEWGTKGPPCVWP